MSEPQKPAFCPQCGHTLSPKDRFCPECGARVPEPPAPEASSGQTAAPPTVVIPPDRPAAPPTVVIPPDQPAAPPPTTVIPPERPATQPTPPIIPPTPSASAPPDPFMPPSSGYGQPGSNIPSYIPPAPPISNSQPNRKLIWGLLGGIGCLLIILVAACGFILVALYTTATNEVTSVFSTPAVNEGGGGAVVSGIGGTELLRDDFDNPTTSSLGVRNDSSSSYSFEQGSYVIEVKEPELLVWALIEGNYRDVVIETSYSTPLNAPNLAAGLIFHYQDEDNFYLFSVSNDGYYALELLENNQWITLIDWTQHNAIAAESNRLRVELSGDQITLFVNDRRLEQTRDPTFTRGEVGLAVTSFDEGGAVVRYDEIIVRQR